MAEFLHWAPGEGAARIWQYGRPDVTESRPIWPGGCDSAHSLGVGHKRLHRDVTQQRDTERMAGMKLPWGRLHGCLRKPLAHRGRESNSEHSFDDPSGVVAYLVVSKGPGAYGTLDLAGTAVCVFVRATLSASIRELEMVRLHLVLT